MLSGEMNERALLSLGLLFACTSRDGPTKALSRAHEKLRDYQAHEPANAIVLTVLGAAAAFYLAERGRNPKVTSFYDALVYTATNLSVGYSDIFARTPGGKAIGSLLMTYGPALAARALDTPGAPPTPTAAPADGASELNEAAVDRIVARLDSILNELRTRSA
jgi:voltage-gated potassium channel